MSISNYPQRSAAISIVRYISMIMIIACHFLQYYNNELAWWLNVGVQVFFVISGYLYGTKDIDNPMAFLKKSFSKILVPYYILLVIVIPLYFFFFPEYLSVMKVASVLVCSGTIKGLGHLWFVSYILFCYLLTPFFYWIRNNISADDAPTRVISIYIAILIIIQILGIAYGSYFHPAYISCFILGFFTADLVSRYGVKVERHILILFFIAAFLMSGAEVYLKYISGISITGKLQTIVALLTKYNHLALGVTLFLGMKTLFQNSKYNPFLLMSDKYSYHIYLVHQFFILSPFSMMKITSFPIINIIASLIAIIVSGVFLNKVSSILLQRDRFNLKVIK